MSNHYAAARRHLDCAEQAIAYLAVEHREAVPNKRKVASLYDEIGHNLKLADVHSQLAIAQQLADLAAPR